MSEKLGEKLDKKPLIFYTNYFLKEDGKFLNEKVDGVLKVLEAVSKEKNSTLSQVALAWVIQQPGVVSAIIGPRTVEHFNDNFGALDVELMEEDLEKIDQVSA